ncbi:MAG: hypothetical protein CMP30_05470 [Roseibacillus sp.]|nr:hypothetical protein [Roseibacillus sp.]
MTARTWKIASAALLAGALLVIALLIFEPDHSSSKGTGIPINSELTQPPGNRNITSSHPVPGGKPESTKPLPGNQLALFPEPLPLDFSSAPFERQVSGTIYKRDVMTMLQDLNNPEQETVSDLQLLEGVIFSYRYIFKQNPVAGENREVVEALSGKNPYRLVFISPSHPALNEGGELVDRWGSPFCFHPISGSQMEFSSAGPDAIFGTPDDIALEQSAGNNE